MPQYVRLGDGREVFEADDEDLPSLLQQGYTVATDEDIGKHNDFVEAGSVGDRALALGEKAIQSATALPGLALGALESLPSLGFGAAMGVDTGEADFSPVAKGFGTDEEIRQRARVSEEEDPILNVAAGLVPEVATAVATSGAGLLPSLAAESLAGGLSRESVESYVKDKEFSATGAAMAVATDLLAGGAILGGGKLLGKGLAGLKGTKPLASSRNWLAEARGKVSKGKLPGEQVKRKPSSGGSAAAEDYRDVDKLAVEDLSKPEYREAVLELAEEADDLRQVAAVSAAKSFDKLDTAAKEGFSIPLKRKDIVKHSVDWTDDMRLAQDKFYAEEVEAAGETLKRNLDEMFENGNAGFGAMANQIRKDIAVARGEAMDPALDRASRMIATDNYKRVVDKGIKRLGHTGARGDVDAQALWIKTIRPHADRMRKGLEDAQKFGKAATEQMELNAGYHKFIDPMSRVQKRLFERLGRVWGEVGATAQARRADAESINAIMAKDADFAGNFTKDLEEALEGLEMAGAARAKFGLGQDAQLEALRDAAEQLRGDFNFATTLGLAQKKAPEIRKGMFGAQLGSDLLEAAPFVGGTAKALGKAAHRAYRAAVPKASAIKQGDPIAEQLSRRFQAYANDPELMADPVFLAGRRDFSKTLLENKGGFGGAGVTAAGDVTTPPAPPPLAPPTPGGPPPPPLPAEGGAAGGMAGGAGLARRRRIPGAPVAGVGAAGGVAGYSGILKAAEQDPETVAVNDALNDIADGTDRAIGRSISRLVSRDTPPLSRGTRELVRRSDSEGVSVAMARFLGRDDDPGKAYQRKMRLLEELEASPEALAERVGSGWGNMPVTHTDVFGEITQQISSVASYLQQVAPRPVGQSVLRPEGYPPAEQLMDEFAGAWQGALDPMSVVEDMEHGVASASALKALRDNWPSLFQRMQVEALSRLQSTIEQGEDIDPAALDALDRDLQMGQMLPLLNSPASMSIVAQATAQVGEQEEAVQSSGYEPTDIGRRLTSPTMSALAPD